MEFIDGYVTNIEFLEEYEGTLPNTPRCYGRVCCICGKDETYIYNGIPVWTKYKDENGKWTGEWTCHNCQRRRKGHKLKDTKRCHLCGRIIISGRKMKELDTCRKWTGYYLCHECAGY